MLFFEKKRISHQISISSMTNLIIFDLFYRRLSSILNIHGIMLYRLICLVIQNVMSCLVFQISRFFFHHINLSTIYKRWILVHFQIIILYNHQTILVVCCNHRNKMKFSLCLFIIVSGKLFNNNFFVLFCLQFKYRELKLF